MSRSDVGYWMNLASMLSLWANRIFALSKGDDIFADLLVGLRVDVRCRDQDAELPVSQPGDEAAGPADTDTVRGLVALGFERKLDRDRIVSRAREIVVAGLRAA